MAHPSGAGPDPIDVAVGARLRAVRRERGLSQEKLAQALGITFQQIQKYERGANRISASMLVKAARALDIGAASLLPEADAAHTPIATSMVLASSIRGGGELIEYYARISPELRRALLRFAQSLAQATGVRPTRKT